MNTARIRALVVLVLMLASVAGAAAWRPTTKLADTRPKIELETLFPKAFADWRVDDRMPVQLVSPDTAALLNKIYNQTLSRTYVNSKGERIMLSVAYGGDQSDATRAHRPEVCYPAQGFQLLANGASQLGLETGPLPVRRLVAKLGGRVEPITYWILVGDRATVTGSEMKLAQLGYSTRGVVPDGMLVRVSSIGTDAPVAYTVHERFVGDLLRSMPAEQRTRVVGSLH